MRIVNENSNYLGKLGTLVIMLILAYFSYHVISGERGLLSLMDLSKKVEESSRKLDVTSAERLKIENRVSLLRDESLDLDLLDEQARRLLGYAGENEVIYNKTED